MGGKYSRKDGPSDRKKSVAAGMMSRHESSSGIGGKRSASQVNVMLNEIVNLFITLFSEFFGLSSHMAMSPRLHDGSGQEGNLPPLPAFIPGNANALNTGSHLLKALAELSDCTNDIGALPAMGIDVQNSLKEFLSATKYRFLESICAVWVRDAKIFWRLEDWTLDSEELSRTIYLKRMETYLRNVARLAYRASGGNEERASNLFVEGKGVALLRRMGNEVCLDIGRGNLPGLTFWDDRIYLPLLQRRSIRRTWMRCMTFSTEWCTLLSWRRQTSQQQLSSARSQISSPRCRQRRPSRSMCARG